LAFMATQKF